MTERSLNSVIEDINIILKGVSFGHKMTTWGLCYLQEKDGKTFPLLNKGRKNGAKISWDDKYPLQVYHRILDVDKKDDLRKGFGANVFIERTYTMRLVGIGSKLKLSSTEYEDNQEFAKVLSDALPSFVNNNEFINVISHEVIKQNVYDSEFSGVNRQKSLSLEGVAFWIDYELKTIIC